MYLLIRRAEGAEKYISLSSVMDFYGVSAASELFRIDDLLDFSNEDLFSPAYTSTTASATTVSADKFPPSQTPITHGPSTSAFANSSSTDFTHDLCFPVDDAAELEWLSQFVDDSLVDIPSNSLIGNLSRDNPGFSGRPRGKRSKVVTATNATSWTSRVPEQEARVAAGRSKGKRDNQGHPAVSAEERVRRCTHCASEKTPQWRTGPMGPKTLCNACGVRYKSGRLVPEYRPAASPTFVLTQHSNSHRKVMELRRQKELMTEQQQQVYRHHHDFGDC